MRRYLAHLAAARDADRPDPTIANPAKLEPRRSVDRFGREVEVSTGGRHDPCVGIRAVPVGEAMMACVLADHLLRHQAQCAPQIDPSDL